MDKAFQMPPMHPIARIKSDFPTKFGLPRQSGLVNELRAKIIFEPEFRVADALRGIEGWSHLWLLWVFSDAVREDWSPTVRPPRLGGNMRMGVFATRSPFRPNPIGLSCVELVSVEFDTPDGPVITVAGADLMDGTPILDIKPYLPFADSRPEAKGGFAEEKRAYALEVVLPPEEAKKLTPEQSSALCAVLAQDPRPAYQNDPDRVYGMPFAGWEVRFSVCENVLTVLDITKI